MIHIERLSLYSGFLVLLYYIIPECYFKTIHIFFFEGHSFLVYRVNEKDLCALSFVRHFIIQNLDAWQQ